VIDQDPPSVMELTEWRVGELRGEPDES
jgi:hypothetical protein